MDYPKDTRFWCFARQRTQMIKGFTAARSLRPHLLQKQRGFPLQSIGQLRRTPCKHFKLTTLPRIAI